MSKPLAFSYVRFSTPEQQHGDSFRRQTEAAQVYAEREGLELADLAFADLGVSAYRGKNIKEGALRAFRDAVESGDIATDSVLIVESMDRLSRSIPRKAVRLLEDLCDAGIVVVTLDDGQRYDTGRLDKDPLAFMLAYMVAMRAHDESAKKGMRVAEAWADKRRRAESEKLTRWCPQWLELKATRDLFDVKEERAGVVRRVFREALAGKGQEAIARDLNIEGVPTFGRGERWHKSSVAKMLRNAAVIGSYQPHRMASDGAGRRFREPAGDPVAGYYPAIIEPKAFHQLQARLDGSRATYQRAGQQVSNPLASLGRCGHCGGAMTRVDKGSRSRPRLVCAKAKVGAGCKYRSILLNRVVAALTDDGAWWVGNAPRGSDEARRDWEALDAEREGSHEAISRLTQELARGGGSIAIAAALREEEGRLHDLEAATERLSVRLARETPKGIIARLESLQAVLSTMPFEPEAANRKLRENLSTVTVWPGDEEDGSAPSLDFHWLQGGETSIPIGGFGKVT